MNNSWKKLSGISKEDLAIARRLSHQAVQLTSITGRCLNPKDPGDKTAALTWLASKNLLAGSRWSGNRHRAAFSFSNLELYILGDEDNIISNYSLNRNTYDDAFKWLTEQVKKAGYDGAKLSKQLPYEIPHYIYADNSPFEIINKDALTELESYYANVDFILKEIDTKNNFSEILCWPHHFDIAASVTVEENPDLEKSKSIGVGMSPGDESYNEPYFYVSPWPYPVETNNLPKLDAGKWHKERWFGAVLTSSEITGFINETDQLKITQDFINSAITASRKILRA